MGTRPRGVFSRLFGLMGGLFGSWVRDREHRNPKAVYERAIQERVRQYSQLKQAVAGILYMRNKLEAEIAERRGEIARLHSDLCRAAKRDEDEVALALIQRKEAQLGELERAENELDQVRTEVETAKANLVRFRSEIRELEREKVSMLATLANARARRQFQEALDGLSLDNEMRALDSVREYIARVRMEGRIDTEMGGDDGLQTRIKEIRSEARSEAARRELDELKRRLRPASIPAERKSEAAVVPAQP